MRKRSRKKYFGLLLLLIINWCLGREEKKIYNDETPVYT